MVLVAGRVDLLWGEPSEIEVAGRLDATAIELATGLFRHRHRSVERPTHRQKFVPISR